MSAMTCGTGIRDEAQNNLSTPSASASITIDNTAPELDSIAVLQSSPTSADTIQFDISFSENVVGLGADDFTLTFAGGNGNPSLSGNGGSYQISVPSGSAKGFQRLLN